MTMRLQKVYQRLVNRPRTRRQAWPQAGRRHRARLGVEQLEDRLTPSNFTAATVSDLITDINAANRQVGTNTITLTAPSASPYLLTAVDNTTNGANGLPVIAKHDTLTIVGNGDTIERSTAVGTPEFRILNVGNGGSLTLQSLTLQNGFAFGSGSWAEGGAIFNQGTLDLNAVTVQNNIAEGQQGSSGIGSNATAGQSAAGGGIYSSGALMLEDGTIVQNNQAIGGFGGVIVSFYGHGGRRPCGSGLGGGVYVAGGTATLTNTTVTSNSAKTFPGYGGGGLYEGGGLYIDPAATVSLDAFTVANIFNNIAWTSNNDIFGSYNPIP
jgi:hypothetical protein